ncbi:MAG: O-antigen ligase family protein [Planctomycetaceae bacterium]
MLTRHLSSTPEFAMAGAAGGMGAGQAIGRQSRGLRELLADRAGRWPAASLYALTSLQTFLAPMDYGIYHDKTPDGVDNVVLIKLLLVVLCFIAAVWGVVSFAPVRRTLLSGWGLMFAALSLLTMLGGTSGIAIESVPMSVINYSYFVFVVTAVHFLGFRVFAHAIMTGIAIAALMATYLFYIVPEVGIFAEAISLTERVARLGGIGHPNSVARSMVLGALLVLFLYRTQQLPRWIFVALLALFGWDALLAKSRTAIAAGLAAACVLYVDKWMTRLGAAVVAILIAIGIMGSVYIVASGAEDRLLDTLVMKLAKSGDKSEILTGTGRTLIWSRSLEIISERPFTGYGLNTATVLLRDYGQSTHNAVLHAALSGGVLAGIIMLAFLLRLGWNILDCPHLGIRSFSTYLFLSCITEDTLLEMFPGPAMLIWFASIAVPFLTADSDPAAYSVRAD